MECQNLIAILGALNYNVRLTFRVLNASKKEAKCNLHVLIVEYKILYLIEFLMKRTI